MSLIDDENFVVRYRPGYERVRIPKGHVKCPDCKGSGRIRWRYSEPSPFNDPSTSDYLSCTRCLGLGHLEKELNDQMEELREKVEEAIKKKEAVG